MDVALKATIVRIQPIERIDETTREIHAFVDADVWPLLDYDTRQNMAAYASLCSVKAATTEVRVVLRHSNTGRELAVF